MDLNQKQRHSIDDGKDGVSHPPAQPGKQEGEETQANLEIVRSNTPRPHSFDEIISSSGQLQSSQQGESAPAFPARAPSAPPLPEEIAEPGEISPTAGTPLQSEPTTEPAVAVAQDFLWLFEYGLEMDPAILNSPERLDGLALLYGPAVLKGHRLMLGATSAGSNIVTIAPSTQPGAEVWGVLYRIPQRVVERSESEPALLDSIHAAITPQHFNKGVQVVVHETYRNREVPSVTYVATDSAYEQLELVTAEQWRGDALMLQRLASIARKQQLPEQYIKQYVTRDVAVARDTQPSLPALPMTNPGLPAVLSVQNEQNTEPLSAIKDTSPTRQSPLALNSGNRRLVAFALYLAVLLVIVLMFSILQGMGFAHQVLTNSFAPLGVPWLVIMYGLLGGCVSCIVTLGRFRVINPPLFVLVTWFIRPFMGAVLAIFSYLLLTSGFFVVGENTTRHITAFWLVGALAGLCEGLIFFRRR